MQEALQMGEKTPSQSSSDGSSEDIDSYGTETRMYNESKWSPDEVERIWIPEVYVRHAMPRWLARFEDHIQSRDTPNTFLHPPSNR